MSEASDLLAADFPDEPLFVEPPSRAKRDYVAVIEAAYNLERDDKTWLRELVVAAYPILQRGMGVNGFVWDLSREGTFRVSLPTYVGCAPQLHDAMMVSGARLTRAQARSLYLQGRPCKLIGAAASERYSRPHAAYRSQVNSAGFLGAYAADLDRTGCALGAPFERSARVSAGVAGAIDHVARHCVAGMRLRRALRFSPNATGTAGADAVFDARGRLLHAEPPAAGRRERERLMDGVERLGACRKARRTEPEHAVEIWRALVLGQWSLVEHWDTDGKRFLLARRNAPDVREHAALTDAERRAAALFSLLGSVKLVAYELGFASSTVSEDLKSACRKLGCRDRAELVTMFSPERGERSESSDVAES